MEINIFIKRLEKLKIKNDEFQFYLGSGILMDDIVNTEKRLKISFPEKIKSFYLNLNGLKTENPSFEILELNSIEIEDLKIHFATFDKKNKIVFDVKQLNPANEWTIFEEKTGFEITKSISSLWSNKIWHWLEKERKVWEEGWWK